jgi:hypothetical protein
MDMDQNQKNELTLRYRAAADSFIEKIKKDVNVVAVIIEGSLAYDQVWEKSDIDATIIVRDQVLKNDHFCIVEDDITINFYVATRSSFKRFLESISGGSFLHSLYAKGSMVYSSEESLYEYFEEFKKIGQDDLEESIFFLACELLHCYDKCLKWIHVKEDPLYAQYYLLKAAEHISKMEVCLAGEVPTREAIVNASFINPELMSVFYKEAMSHHYSVPEILAAIEKMEQYMEQHLDIIKKPILKYMSDGEMKTVTMITKYFKTDGHFIIGILDYLADKGVIAKVSQTIKITPKSKLAVEEIAYQYIG